jgi:RNA polymerase sigma factor (sigma-70 family)
MSTSTLGLFLRHLAMNEEVSRLGTTSDHNLLDAYDAEKGQAAFTELLRRHGPMVLRTCRRLLSQESDAEDAFQATFVLLAQKAGSISKREALGAWLHRVAYHTALQAFRRAVRRKAHERQASVMTHPDPDPVTKASWNEIWPILDAELDALPEEARRLLIAFYLEEKTYTEVTAELGLPRSSVAWRLEKARILLAARLARRGITVSSLMLAILLEDSAKGAVVPAVLLVHTVDASRRFAEQAAGIVSENVDRLVKDGLAQMTRGWTHWSMALAGWVSLLGAGLIACQSLRAWPDQPPENAPTVPRSMERPTQEGEKQSRTDCYGDPLPPGALARLGTVRLFNGERNSNHSKVLAFSPDGKILASHIDRMTVVLWDAATGKEIRRLTTDAVEGWITSLGFSPDGKTLLAVAWELRDRKEKVCLWDTTTGNLLRTMGYQGPKRDNVTPGRRMAFLPEGRMLAVADFLKAVEGKEGIRGIYVWDVATGKEVRQLNDSRKRPLLSATAFSPDGELLATAVPSDFTLWNVATGKQIWQLPYWGSANDFIKALAFSHDGKTLAAADSHAVSVCDPATGKLLRRLEASSHPYGPLAFSPDGKVLVGGEEGHLWEVSTGKEIRSLGLKDVQVALFSADGKTLAVGDAAGVIRLWDMASGKEIFPHPGHRQRIWTVAYSPDGKTLASVSEARTVRLWDTATGKELRQLAKHTQWGSEVIAYSPDGKVLASLEQSVLHVWDTAAGKEIRQFRDPLGSSYHSVAFSPDGKLVAACTKEGVALWEAATGKEVYKLENETETLNRKWSLAFSPDGRVLAAPGKDNTVSLWEVATGKPVAQLGGQKPPGPRGEQARVRFLAFSPDGRVLAASSSEDDKVRLWEMASGQEIGQLDGYKHREDSKQAPRDGCVLAFSPDSRMLATAVPGRNYNNGVDLAVTLWEVANGKKIGCLSGHRNVIQTLAFAPDGKTLASAGDDLTCLVWDVAA